MRLIKNQQGMATLEVVLVVVIVAAIAVAGVRVLNANDKSTATDGDTANTQQADVSTAPTINSKEDLTKAEATLDQNDPEAANSSDTNQLDSQLSTN